MFESDEEFEEYCREVNAAYYVEEEEYKAGIHPTQIIERLEKVLNSVKVVYKKISFLITLTMEKSKFLLMVNITEHLIIYKTVLCNTK